MLRLVEWKLVVVVAESSKWGQFEVSRSSHEIFDIKIEGEIWRERRPDIKFSAWLPLATISAVNWPEPRIWMLSDGYGEPGLIPPQGHDWSGIRDSSDKAIWAMFDKARQMLSTKSAPGRAST